MHRPHRPPQVPRQRVGLAAALLHNPEVLILDEPTAVLTPQETDELLNVMKVLKSKGTSIIFITHKLREVKEVADKITIIRLGKVVGTQLPTASQEELASLMVGRQVDLAPNKTAFSPGANVLEINKLNIFNVSSTLLIKLWVVEGLEVRVKKLNLRLSLWCKKYALLKYFVRTRNLR